VGVVVSRRADGYIDQLVGPAAVDVGTVFPLVVQPHDGGASPTVRQSCVPALATPIDPRRRTVTLLRRKNPDLFEPEAARTFTRITNTAVVSSALDGPKN